MSTKFVDSCKEKQLQKNIKTLHIQRHVLCSSVHSDSKNIRFREWKVHRWKANHKQNDNAVVHTLQSTNKIKCPIIKKTQIPQKVNSTYHMTRGHKWSFLQKKEESKQCRTSVLTTAVHTQTNQHIQIMPRDSTCHLMACPSCSQLTMLIHAENSC